MRSLTVIGADDVRACLDDGESNLVDVVAHAYRLYADGRAVLPASPFLRLDPSRPERIIALPAGLVDDEPVAGIKWIASYPDNVLRGLDRASATILLNDPKTGYAFCLMEGAQISAARTAAGAALAARLCHRADEGRVGIVGCGYIAWTTLQYLRAVLPELGAVRLYDLAPERAHAFGERARAVGLDAEVADSAADVLAAEDLVVLATVASTPHLDVPLRDTQTLLHLSLRDLAPAMLRAAHNVVDSVSHVLTSQTSLHLAATTGGTDGLVAGTIAEVDRGTVQGRRSGRATVVSPFGMGVLDLAVARRVWERARARGLGVEVPDFLPAPWRAA